MAGLVLMDNDAALKLARYDLLDQALLTMGCTPGEVRVLHTASYALLPAKAPLRHCKDEASADRLRAFLRQVGAVDQAAVNTEWLDALVEIPGIDPGEALLFALAATQPDAIIVTGDKRAMRALCAAPEASGIVAALAGRVLCMETLFRGLVEQEFALTQQRVRANGEIDKALAAIFGVTNPAPLDSVQQGLDSYEGALRAETGTLLKTSVAN